MDQHLGSLTLFSKEDFESDWRKVASGGFGQVFLVKHKRWRITYAVKCTSGHLQETGCDRTSMNSLIEEAAKMERVKFQHIVSIYGVCESPLGIVMEYMANQSLEKILPTHQMAWQLKFRIIHETSLAMNFLHSLKPPLLHLDLKPGNILLDANMHVKISDFGLSKWMEQSSRMQYIERSALRGTLSYIPPEMLLQSTSPPGTKFDVYSFGIVVWEILTQKKPYAGASMMGIIVSVAAGKRPSLEGTCDDWPGDSHQMADLMKRCWDQKPKQRPSFADVSVETDMLLCVIRRPKVDPENERLFRKTSVKPTFSKSKQNNTDRSPRSQGASATDVEDSEDQFYGPHQGKDGNLEASRVQEEASEARESDSDWLRLIFVQENLEEVQLLLAKGESVNWRTACGCTPLILAVQSRSVELVSLLVDRGADANLADDDGWAPLHFVAQNGDDRVARLLLDHQAHVDARELDGWTPLHLASQNNFESVARVLLSRQADPNAQENEGRTPLHVAAHFGHVGLVKMLASQGADLERKQKNQRTPLHLAVEKGQFRVVQFLLKNGATINSLDQHRYSGLHMAAAKGRYLICEKLIKYGANVGLRTEKGWTPLHLASIKGHVEIIRLFVDSGASVNAQGSMKWTALHLATRYSGEAVVAELLRSGADPNIAENSGWTPLHLAVQRGSLFSVLNLLQHKAGVNTRNKAGWTPIHLAVLTGHTTIVKALLQAGALLGLQDNTGCTPLQLALRNQKQSMVDLLQGSSTSQANLRGLEV